MKDKKRGGMILGKVIDLASKRKRMEDKYPLDRSHGILALMYHIHNVREMRFIRGDYDASNLLIDFEDSLQGAKLTDQQSLVLRLVFELDLTQQEAAILLNVTQQTVSDHINTAVAKIAKYNRKREADCA